MMNSLRALQHNYGAYFDHKCFAVVKILLSTEFAMKLRGIFMHDNGLWLIASSPAPVCTMVFVRPTPTAFIVCN